MSDTRARLWLEGRSERSRWPVISVAPLTSRASKQDAVRTGTETVGLNDRSTDSAGCRPMARRKSPTPASLRRAIKDSRVAPGPPLPSPWPLNPFRRSLVPGSASHRTCRPSLWSPASFSGLASWAMVLDSIRPAVGPIPAHGSRMFPFLSFNISALDQSAHYNVFVDVVLADQHHWRYQGGKWVQCGKAEGNMPGNRMYMHPDSPNTGAHWMRQEISFGKLKLTNNKGSSNNLAQMIVLQSLHKYQPRLHIVEVKEDGTEDPFLASKAQTFVFPETQFIAVTAYQNADVSILNCTTSCSTSCSPAYLHRTITQLKIDHNPFAKGFRDNYDTLYAPPDSAERLTPSPSETQPLLPSGCYTQPYLGEPYVSSLPQGRFYGRDRASGAQPAKEPGGGPHGHWYLPGQQGVPSNRLDFNSYEGDYSAGGFYKPFPLQGSAHPHLSYYPDHPFTPSGVSGATSGAWGASRPSPQYLGHSHPSKAGPGLGWFRPVPPASSSSASSDPRVHPSALLEPPPLPPALLPDKPKEPGEDPWLEPTSVRSVDSADSGLYDGAESKRRRVSPYASSTESSPPTRGTEAGEKDSGSDAGYYGFYNN
ncbi:T-box transcription factor TBX21-like [Scleropages formosus]|uniref:T-box transcription factor TBX21-like n=1 Tax=Scleropages formosus TaxID=113540 RepID=A0A0P7UTH1_SCLFO|nr:T-box transcription factor TBX21-like [Scleropages formosus]